ncbi:MAG TPA: tRNA (adenosine(37)-N6)-threonylcarbamoyltransferase complex dimerization subunit type 1 TsaB [Stellaceae bacterium]|jgi:tRNA threonylcarbamoyladenosine biosynthesis protein TsaB|nr:tRNA (adenosine(37)-N6)-threonylcarbamoyltransferase complex dimerization subunit type 1 TsaB [Stellaceae bacterium]
MRWPPRVGLALDSAGLACSVAVSLGEEVVAEEQIGTMHGQAEALLPLVNRAMREAGQMAGALDFVVATVGPGSFTGIRVGLAAARGIALATGARLIGVTSFDAVAVPAVRNDWPETPSLLVALESRREDFYVQFFSPHGDALREPAAIMPFLFRKAVAETIGVNPLLIAGDAAQRAAAALEQRPDTVVLEDSAPGAVGALRAGLRLVRFGKVADTPRPLYLRSPDVTTLHYRRDG